MVQGFIAVTNMPWSLRIEHFARKENAYIYLRWLFQNFVPFLLLHFSRATACRLFLLHHQIYPFPGFLKLSQYLYPYSCAGHISWLYPFPILASPYFVFLMKAKFKTLQIFVCKSDLLLSGPQMDPQMPSKHLFPSVYFSNISEWKTGN